MITREQGTAGLRPEGAVVVTRDPSWMPAPEAGAFEVRSPEEGLEMMEERALANSRQTARARDVETQPLGWVRSGPVWHLDPPGASC